MARHQGWQMLCQGDRLKSDSRNAAGGLALRADADFSGGRELRPPTDDLRRR